MLNQLALSLTHVALHSPAARLADSALDNICQGAGVTSGGTTCASKSNLTGRLTGHVQTITNTLLYVAGAVAVIIIIISGIRYITSAGDAATVKQAKDTLFYAIIGLVVVILAYAIVNFVGSHV